MATEIAPASRRPSNLVIGLAGPVGSGCSSMAGVLHNRSLKSYRLSDEIRNEMKAEGCLPRKRSKDYRKNLQDYGNRRRETSLSYWVDKLLEKVRRDGIGQAPIAIDGIRNLGEVHRLRHEYPNFFLVAICAEREHRWNRVKPDYRGRQSDFERDDRRDQNEDMPHGQQVQRCVDDADFVYFNNEQHMVRVAGEDKPGLTQIATDLQRQADDFVPLMERRTGGRLPTPQEVQMAAAYALSNASSCLKRHVGAVVTIARGGREIPLSMGYNENPAGVGRCVDNGGCSKDEYMRSWFAAQAKVHCPRCGAKLSTPTETTRCKCGDSIRDWLRPLRGMELCTAVHAEERAIKSLGDRSAEGGKLYVTTFPCFQCSRMILDVGIKDLVYVEAYPVVESQSFLRENGCRVNPFNGFTARSFFRVFRKVS